MQSAGSHFCLTGRPPSIARTWQPYRSHGSCQPRLLLANPEAFLRLVECGRGHARIEMDVLAEVEAIGDMVGIRQDLGLRRVLLRQSHSWSICSEKENEYCMLATSQRAPG